jgi:hypothetical protein
MYIHHWRTTPGISTYFQGLSNETPGRLSRRNSREAAFQKLRPGATPVALGMVLTEWKRSNANPDAAFEAAKQQAALYSGGVLAGVELASHRYLVVVTKNQIVPPADVTDGAVIYRHINIAVEPQSPSMAAKRLAK